MDAAALLHGEVHGVAVGRPAGRALTVVNRGPDFAAAAAVSVHDTHMSVFHSGFAIGEAAAGTAKQNALAVGRPARVVLNGFSRGDAPAGIVGHFERVNVIVEELV